MKGLHPEFSAQFSYLDQKIYTKASMLALSHALEDMVIGLQFKPELFVVFQDFQFFAVEKERYLRLDQLCHRIFIFARHIDVEQTAGFKNTVFISLEEGAPLGEEWDIIINHPQHPMAWH